MVHVIHHFDVHHFARRCLPMQMRSWVLAGPMGRAGPQAVGKTGGEYLFLQASVGISPLKGFLYRVAGKYRLEVSLCIRIS